MVIVIAFAPSLFTLFDYYVLHYHSQIIRFSIRSSDRPVTSQNSILIHDKETLKVVFESRVTWATSVPILVFLGLSFLELGPMYATERQTSDRRTYVRQKHRLMPPPIRCRGIIRLIRWPTQYGAMLNNDSVCPSVNYSCIPASSPW